MRPPSLALPVAPAPPAIGMVGIDGADRHLALQQQRQLGDGLERLVLDRGLRQAADVRRRDDARVA